MNTEIPSGPQITDEVELQPKPRRKTGLIIGGIVLVLVLAGAAFLGGRLLNKKAPQTNNLIPGMEIVKGGGGGPSSSAGMVVSGDGPGQQSIQINFKPAPELPELQPDANGLFLKREDNRITLGTGNVGMTISSSSSSGEGVVSSEPQASYDGPEVEVVVTQATKIYRDITPMDPEQTSGTIQQVVEPGTLDDLTTQSSLTVWGKKTGDRIIADVVFYTRPVMFFAPANK
jgi:hypothetical protein